ncbi:MAG TPA: LysM peptidoglycan-binding domain-containing protein [Verrucomicrobiae bacterium]|jgi:septal ring factor EnvC (AmiA/AmiB activator)|nr:LysM peptidoglycan-binding domain-containing protein [Verrucomicrobiae bacterium]
MRKISLWLFIFVFTASLARAQDSATQDQIDQINGKIQDLLDAQAAQGKRIDALEKEISDLSDKSSQPGVAASPDDLKKLAEQVQEIDKKRQDDNERILKELERLDKSMGVSPPSHKTEPSVSTPSTSSATSSGPQKGYEYLIASGDTISAIAKAYRAKGIKVTSDQILAVNPGLNPNSLVVGKKIFIPDANAK